MTTLNAMWRETGIRVLGPDPQLFEARCGRRGCCPQIVLSTPGRADAGSNSSAQYQQAPDGVYELTPRVRAAWEAFRRRGGNWRDFRMKPRHIGPWAERHPIYPLPALFRCPLCGFVNLVSPLDQ